MWTRLFKPKAWWAEPPISPVLAFKTVVSHFGLVVATPLSTPITLGQTYLISNWQMQIKYLWGRVLHAWRNPPWRRWAPPAKTEGFNWSTTISTILLVRISTSSAWHCTGKSGQTPKLQIDWSSFTQNFFCKSTIKKIGETILKNCTLALLRLRRDPLSSLHNLTVQCMQRQFRRQRRNDAGGWSCPHRVLTNTPIKTF